MPKKTTEISEVISLSVYDIDYLAMRLNVLESAQVGEFVLANRIKFSRDYVNCMEDAEKFSMHTCILD